MKLRSLPPLLSHNPRTRLSVPIATLVCGAVIIGVASSLIVDNVQFFYGFAEAYSVGGGDPGFTIAVGALAAGIAGAGLMLIAGLFGLAGHFTSNNHLLYLFVALAFVGGLCSIVGGGIFLSVPSMVGENIYIDATDQIQPPLQGVQRDMNDFELAIYNECCVTKNWTQQGAAIQCTGNINADCPSISNPVITQNLPNPKVLLCSCAYSATKMQQFENAIAQTGFCAKGQNALINVNGLRLPSKAGNFQLTFLTSLMFSFSYSFIPFIGYDFLPTMNPDHTDAQAHPYPFGCGLGFMKGIQWVTDIWFQQNAYTPAAITLAFGLLEVGVVIFSLIVSRMQERESLEGIENGKFDKWDNLRDIPADFAKTGPVTNNPTYQNEKGSYPNSAIVTNAAIPEAVIEDEESTKEQEALSKKLRAFYAKFDKGKSLDDVEDVTKWTMLNGIPALNEKLKKKYGEDLDSVRISSSKGLGVKALEKDLDI